LVRYQQAWLQCEHTRNADALALAAGEFARQRAAMSGSRPTEANGAALNARERARTYLLTTL
jgi:hypothetical protein